MPGQLSCAAAAAGPATADTQILTPAQGGERFQFNFLAFKDKIPELKWLSLIQILQ